MNDPTVRIEPVVSGELPPLSTSLYRDKARRGSGVVRGLSKVGRGSVTEGVTVRGQTTASPRTVVTQPLRPRTLAEVVESQQRPSPTNPAAGTRATGGCKGPYRGAPGSGPSSGATLAGRVLAGLGRKPGRK